MTTTAIEALANRGSIARADFDIKMTLRRIAIPRFLLQVDNVLGRWVHWRRRILALNFTTAARVLDLPSEFDRVDEVYLEETGVGIDTNPLAYIGEHPKKVIEAEVATTPGHPSGYYIVAGTSTPWAMKLDIPLAKNLTARGTYYRLIPFSDDAAEVDLDPYIPANYQAALVHLLRAEIFRDRFGIGDQRYATEKELYDEFIQLMAVNREPAPRNRAVFVR